MRFMALAYRSLQKWTIKYKESYCEVLGKSQILVKIKANRINIILQLSFGIKKRHVSLNLEIILGLIEQNYYFFA